MPFRQTWSIPDLQGLEADSFTERADQQIRSFMSRYTPPDPLPSFDAPATAPAPATPSLSLDLKDWTPWNRQPEAAAPAPETPPPGGLSFNLADWAPWHETPKPAAPSSTPGPDQTPQGTPVRSAGEMAPEVAAARSTAPQPMGDIIEGDPQGFFQTARPYAEAAEREFGVPAALSLAIAANETGYGQRRYMAGNSNYHGIQASATDPNGVPYVDWRPGPNGEKVSYAARQASFSSPLEGFRGFARFLTDNPRYALALARYRQTGDVNQLAADVHAAGYAEDPAYTTKIQSIIKGIPVSTGVGEVTAQSGVRPGSGQPAAMPEQASQAATGSFDVQGIARVYEGVPYVFGGAGGRSDFRLGAASDCSGFVSSVFKNVYGVDLAAHTDTSYNQLRQMGAPEVGQQDARPGDVVYYLGAGTGGSIAHHMGIYAGPGKVLDMASSGRSEGVRVRDIGHAGKFVILRDPRVNPEQPRRASTPPEIVETGYAERSPTTGTPSPRQVDAVIATYGDAGDTIPNAGVPPAPAAPPPQPPAAQQPTPAVAAGGARTSEIGQAATAGDPFAMKLDAQPMPEDASDSERYADGLNTTLPPVPPPFRNEVPFNPETGQAGWPGMQRAPLDGAMPVRDNWASEPQQQPYDPRDADQGPHEGGREGWDVQSSLSAGAAPLMIGATETSNGMDTQSGRNPVPTVTSQTGGPQSDSLRDNWASDSRFAPPLSSSADTQAGAPVLDPPYDPRVQDEAPGARELPVQPPVGPVNGPPLPAGRSVGSSWAGPEPVYGPVDPWTQPNPLIPGNVRPSDLPQPPPGAEDRSWRQPPPQPQGGIVIPDATLDRLVPRYTQQPPTTSEQYTPTAPPPAGGLRQPQYRRQEPAEDAAAEIERDRQYQPGPPSNPLERVVAATAEAPFLRETPADQAVAIYNAITELPFDAYAVARRQLISDAEAKRVTGIDPIAPLRAAFPDAPWPSVETLNPARRPAGDVLMGLMIAGALPDPTDPLVATAFRGVGQAARGAGALGRVVGRGAASAADAAGSAIRGAGRVLSEGRATARALNEAPSGGTVLPGTLGISPDENMMRGLTRPRVVPPEVADTLDQFPIRVPTDPATVRAIEAVGGRVDPERGVTLTVTRAQAPKAAGGSATRGGVFYEAVPEGGRSSFVGADNPHSVGGSQVIPPQKTRFRSPLILDAPPGEARGFQSGMEQMGVRVHPDIERAQSAANTAEILRRQAIDARDTAVDRWKQANPGADIDQWVNSEDGRYFLDAVSRAVKESDDARILVRDLTEQYPPPTADAVDAAIRAARAAGPEGSPARAQALKDVVSRYGGDPNLIDDLLAIRGADASESAWAIKENILTANARRQGYDGVVTVQPKPQNFETQMGLQALVDEHPDMQAAVREVSAASEAYRASPTPETAQRVKEATAQSKAVRARLTEEMKPHHITELVDAREGRNPTPGAPNPRIAAAEAEFEAAMARAKALGRGNPEFDDAFAEVERANLARRQARAEEPAFGPSGYALREDVRTRPQRAARSVAVIDDEMDALHPMLESGQIDDAEFTRRLQALQHERNLAKGDEVMASAGALPQTPGSGVLPAFNRAASEAIVGGTGGAVIEQARNPDEDPRTAAARGFMMGAVGFPLATRAARGAARLAGAAAPEGGGALATLGHLPVDPARVAAEADAGPIRGANLNRRLPQEGSAIPLRVRAANALTDDQAALRWAEDLLTEDAGRGKLPEGAVERASALRRRNPDSIAEQRIRDELVPTVARARKDGLLDELTQYLQDTHERDVLAEFYRRGHDEAIEAGKTAAEAETAGLVRMRRRSSANTALSYEGVTARLEGQQQRLGDRFGDLDEMASSVWSHNRATLDRMLESGRITPEQHAWMTETYPHYVPTVPVSQLDAGGGRAAVGRGSGVSAGRSGPGDVKAFEDVASESERLNPIIASRDATIARERVAHRNEVFQAFARLYDEAQQFGSDAATPSLGSRRQRFAGEVEVSGRVDGEPASIRVPKPVAEVIDTMGQMGVGGGAMGIWRAAMSAVTTSITGRRLSFAPVNLARDLGDSLLRAGSEYGVTAIPEYLNLWARQAGNAAVDLVVGAVRGQLPVTGAAKEYLRRGGGMGPARGGWKAGEDWYAAAARSGGMPVTGPGDVARILKDLATFKPVMAINERAELISRTAMMQLAERHGAGANEAMIAGRNASIDFQRAGTVVRMFNGAIPFLNATVQSGAQLARTVRAHPKSATATFATVVGLPVIAAEAYNRSDPGRAQAYDDVPQYLKDQGIVVMLPWAGSDTRGERPNYAWLPLGMGAPVAVAIREAMRDVPLLEPASPRSDLPADASEAQRWASVAEQVFSVFSPIKGESATAAASSLIPPGAKQLVELGTNKNLFTGGTIAIDAADERASAFARGAAGLANEAGRTLGSDFLQEVRPSQVDYLGRQLPAYGDVISGVSDMVAPSPTKQAEDRPIQNAPVVGGPAGRLIRDTGGAGLERARNDMLSPTIRDALIDADMRPSDIQAVPSSLSVDGKKIPLMRDEQTRYQERTNVYANREIAATARSSEWRARGADREKLVKEAMARARERAEQEILQRIRPAERQRRTREAESMKVAS